MLTEFGKFIRIYRLEHGMILKEMADMLSVPSSYLSAMEMGRKAITSDFVEKLLSTFSFTEEEAEKLRQAVELSAATIKMPLGNVDSIHRNAALSFARKFESLDEETIKRIMELLK